MIRLAPSRGELVERCRRAFLQTLVLNYVPHRRTFPGLPRPRWRTSRRGLSRRHTSRGSVKPFVHAAVPIAVGDRCDGGNVAVNHGIRDQRHALSGGVLACVGLVERLLRGSLVVRRLRAGARGPVGVGRAGLRPVICDEDRARSTGTPPGGPQACEREGERRVQQGVGSAGRPSKSPSSTGVARKAKSSLPDELPLQCKGSHAFPE
jgi:hypothetical protein